MNALSGIWPSCSCYIFTTWRWTIASSLDTDGDWTWWTTCGLLIGSPLPHVRVIDHAVGYLDVSFAMTQTSSITKCYPTFCDLHYEATEEDMNCWQVQFKCAIINKYINPLFGHSLGYNCSWSGNLQVSSITLQDNIHISTFLLPPLTGLHSPTRSHSLSLSPTTPSLLVQHDEEI